MGDCLDALKGGLASRDEKIGRVGKGARWKLSNRNGEERRSMGRFADEFLENTGRCNSIKCECLEKSRVLETLRVGSSLNDF